MGNFQLLEVCRVRAHADSIRKQLAALRRVNSWRVNSWRVNSWRVVSASSADPKPALDTILENLLATQEQLNCETVQFGHRNDVTLAEPFDLSIALVVLGDSAEMNDLFQQMGVRTKPDRMAINAALSKQPFY